MEKSSCSSKISAYTGECQPDFKNIEEQVINQLTHRINQKKVDVLKSRIEELGLIVDIDLCINLHLIKVEMKGNEETYIYSDGISDLRIVTFLSQDVSFDAFYEPNIMRATIKFY